MKTRRFGVSTDVDALDTERIVRTLASHGVDYILVGGLAALAHGSTIATADADVLPRLDIANLERLLDALEELGAAILISDRRRSMEAGDRWEAAELNGSRAGSLESADAWHFTTDAGPVDVVVRATGVGSYDAHAAAAEARTVFDVRIQVAGVNDLIASKVATGRPTDEAILRELKELRENGDA